MTPEELPDEKCSSAGWSYHPVKTVTISPPDAHGRKQKTHTVHHWVKTPTGNIVTMPFVPTKISDYVIFRKWVTLGSPTIEMLGCLVRTINHLKDYQRRLQTQKIIEQMAADGPFPEPSAFGAKRFNLKFVKELRALKTQYEATNEDLPVLARLADSRAAQRIMTIIERQSA